MEAGFTAPDRVTVPAPELLKTRFWPAAVSAEPSMPHWAPVFVSLQVMPSVPCQIQTSPAEVTTNLRVVPVCSSV